MRISWKSDKGKSILEAVVSAFEDNPELSSTTAGRKRLINDTVEETAQYPTEKILGKVMQMVYTRMPTGSPSMPPLVQRMKHLWYQKWQSSAVNLVGEEGNEEGRDEEAEASVPSLQLGDASGNAATPSPTSRKRRRTIVDALDDFRKAKFHRTCTRNGDAGVHDFKAHPTQPIIFCTSCGYSKKLE